MLCSVSGFYDGKPMYKISGSYIGVKHHPMDKIVPCGQCMACRLNKASDWASRMVLELDHSKTALFFTLTYDDVHLPVVSCDGVLYGTLVKEHVQKFLKRLRRHFEPLKLRYYLSGEYGDKTYRPHYHAIIYGLSLSSFPDIQIWSKNDFNQYYYVSDELNSIWSYGRVIVGNVSFETCAYCARYTCKKVTGLRADEWYQGRLSEFALMSRKPGLGAYYLLDHPEFDWSSRIYLNDCNVNGTRSINKVFTPAYLYDKLRLTNPELYDSIRSVRSFFASQSYHKELSNTDIGLLDYGRVCDEASYSSLSALQKTKI